MNVRNVGYATLAALFASGCSNAPMLVSTGSSNADGGVDADVAPAQTGADAGESKVCGDGLRSGSEICDDRNTVGGDGCSADCRQVEPGYVCMTAGIACAYTAVCGDKQVFGREQCDDGNGASGDGCSASCQLEPGYACRMPGSACRAAACGDGFQVALEACDDGNGVGADGCDARCRLEPGFACAAGSGCRPTQCGDGKVEGSEQCDDGNEQPYDGCFRCQNEPRCQNDACMAVCGDGIKFPNEACDDGNTRAGDGCSGSCALEAGFSCSLLGAEPLPSLDMPVVYRDLRGADLPPIEASGIAAGHPDFQRIGLEERLLEPGLVMPVLGDDKKPLYGKFDGTSITTSGAAPFYSWYHDDPRQNRTVIDRLVLQRQAGGGYVFESAEFFPLDGRGFMAEGAEPGRDIHNFSFTSELRYWFAYQGGERLDFFGDDDVWVFVNGRLAVDLGGVHGALAGSVTLSSDNAAAYGLSAGNIYEIVVFQAERYTWHSAYKLTLRGFERATSRCASICGDGIVTPDEVCDDRKNDGSYGSCTPDCQGFGPYCGDGAMQADRGEQCDDGNKESADRCDNSCRSVIVL